MVEREPQSGQAGCGLLGCLGGLLVGLVGGALLISVATFFVAINATLPTTTSPSNSPDIKISLTEDFLNRFNEQPDEGSVQVDVQPGNQIQVTANTVAEVFGASLPVQVAGLFQITTTPQSIRVNLVDTQVFGLDLDLSGLFEEDIDAINRQLETMLQNVSQTLGTPVELAGVETTDSTITIEFREAQ